MTEQVASPYRAGRSIDRLRVHPLGLHAHLVDSGMDVTIRCRRRDAYKRFIRKNRLEAESLERGCVDRPARDPVMQDSPCDLRCQRSVAQGARNQRFELSRIAVA